MKSTGFPLPVICNLIPFAKSLSKRNEYSESHFIAYMNDRFNGNIPPTVIDFISSKGLIITSDPDFLRDIYVTKAKYMDKFYRIKDVMYILFGDSLLFDKASERQVTKRKHLSAAFYKDKMQTLLGQIIELTYKKVQKVIEDVKNGKVEIDIVEFVNTTMMENMLICIFGVTEFAEDPVYLF